MSRFTEKLEQMLQRPVWVIDILPEQVVSCPPGKYFTVEKYFIKDPEVIRKKRNLALKLNCYYDLEILVDDTELRNPSPEDLASLVESVLCFTDDKFPHNDMYLHSLIDNPSRIYHALLRLYCNVRVAEIQASFMGFPKDIR